jgi:8-hydroxy-5-deazaflavin:NADPH oxidoreductase
MVTTVGVLGGTGPAGRGLAVRLAQAGHDVVIGSRDADRASDIAHGLVTRGSGSVRGASNEDAAQCDIVVVATPWESAVELATSLREQLADKVVISMVNALVKRGREMVPLLPGRGSMTAELAAALPRSRVAGAFHHLPAAQMEDLDSGLAADVIVVGDDVDARAVTVGLTNEMEGLRAVEAGSLALAGAVESFTAVCISVNIRHRAHSTVTLTGLA